MEMKVLKARITRAWGGGAALVYLWNEAFDSAAGEKEWLKRLPAALYSCDAWHMYDNLTENCLAFNIIERIACVN